MISVLAAMAVASAPAAASYPIEPILSAARSSCQSVFGAPDPDKALSADGWVVARAVPGSWLESELEGRWDAAGTPHREYTKAIGGRAVYLIFGTDPDPRMRQTICTFRDPEAVLSSGADKVLRWAGKEPVKPAVALPQLAGLDDVGFVKRWQPGLSEGSDETMINYATGLGLNYFAVRYEKAQ